MNARRLVVLGLALALCTRRGRHAIGNLMFTAGLELMPLEERAEEFRRRGRARMDRDIERYADHRPGSPQSPNGCQPPPI